MMYFRDRLREIFFWSDQPFTKVLEASEATSHIQLAHKYLSDDIIFFFEECLICTQHLAQ